jgi:hypothetical protein
MAEYLGVQPLTDSQGVLQDIHWSDGLFGYFPTYALGNVIAAQLWKAANHELPDLSLSIRKGEFAHLLHWLRQKIHLHGLSSNQSSFCSLPLVNRSMHSLIWNTCKKNTANCISYNSLMNTSTILKLRGLVFFVLAASMMSIPSSFTQTASAAIAATALPAADIASSPMPSVNKIRLLYPVASRR